VKEVLGSRTKRLKGEADAEPDISVPRAGGGEAAAGPKSMCIPASWRMSPSASAWRRAAPPWKASDDGMIRLARLVDEPARKLLKKHQETIDSLAASAAERIAQYRFRLFGPADYPDATSTPRVSYGVVKAYHDRTEASVLAATTSAGCSTWRAIRLPTSCRSAGWRPSPTSIWWRPSIS
jgi:hypothetical protein